MRVVHIQKHLVRSPAEVVVKFTLGALDSLEAAEAEQVGLAHISHETVIRECDIHKFLDVTRVACSHLHDCKLSLRTDLQKGKRNAYAVVQVALSCGDAVLHRKDFSYEFLSGSLSVCSRQSNDCQGFSVNYGHRPVPSCKLLQGLECILDLDQPRIIRITGRAFCIHHRIGRTCFQRLECILITVKILTLQGKEHLSALDCAAVGSHDTAFKKLFVDI